MGFQESCHFDNKKKGLISLSTQNQENPILHLYRTKKAIVKFVSLLGSNNSKKTAKNVCNLMIELGNLITEID